MKHIEEKVLKIKQLRVCYPTSKHWILDGVDLCLKAGEKLAIAGPSGCGKSTLGRAIVQLLPVGSICTGELLLNGQDPRSLDQIQLKTLRGESVGFVFQDPMTRLNPLMTIGSHLMDTLSAHLKGTSFEWRINRSKELLDKVGIQPNRFNCYPHELSGGMRQRLSIALAIALNPLLVIADEPTTSLDVVVANQVMSELSTLCEDLGSALLVISHDLALSARWCNRLAILDNGHIVEEDYTSNILTRPQSKVGKNLLIAARAKEKALTPEELNSPIVLEVDRLRCWHQQISLPWKDSWLKAVNEVTFSLRAGESLGVVGVSGCGKSTLCRALMGLAPIRGGDIKLQGKSIVNMKGKKLKLIRKDMQMIFQDPLACLNPKMTVGDAVADPFLIHNLGDKKAAKQNTFDLLAEVGLEPVEKFYNRFPKQLSGGQQQRIVIARALALKPKVLICDEIVSMLDAQVQADILQLLRNLQIKRDLSMVFITHELSVATGFCNRVIVLHNGRVVEEGPGDKLFRSPKSLMARCLMEACPRLPE